MMARKFLLLIISCVLVTSTMSAQVSAAVVSTRDAVSNESREYRIADVRAKLSREEVMRAMIELGVDPQQAVERVASLSDAELLQVNNQLDSVPAGSGALAVIGIVFLVLLILDVTGVIHIFRR